MNLLLAVSAALLGITSVYYSLHLIFLLPVLFLYAWWKTRQKRVLFFCGVIFLLFLVRMEVAERNNESVFNEQTEYLEAVILNTSSVDGDQVQWMMREVKHHEKFFVTLYMAEENEKHQIEALTPGSICRVKGTWKKPAPASNFSAFDYQEYMYKQQVHWMIEVSGMDHLLCSYQKQDSLLSTVQQWRDFGIKHIRQQFPEELQGMSSALIFGDRNEINPGVEKAYQQLGLIHLLAVSGLHVGIISGVLYYAGLRTGITRERMSWILIGFLPFYALLAGGAPSVWRAVLIAMLVLLYQRFARKSLPPVTALGTAALVMLLADPYYGWHIGFQLSFFISLSLLLSFPLLQRLSSLPLQLFGVSAAAQTASLPIILYHFYEFSLLSYVLNIAFVPFVSLILLPFCFFLFFLSLFIPSAAVLLMKPVEAGIRFLHDNLQVVAESRVLQVVTGQPNVLELLFLSVSLLFLFAMVEKGRRIGICLAAGSLAAVFGWLFFAPYFDSKGAVTVIDVGQGDSILIELPYRRGVYLIDGGGALSFPKEEWQERKTAYDPGERIVVPVLKSKGIRAIDKLIVTHGDIDHYGGLYAVMEHTNIHQVLYGRSVEEKEAERHFLETVHQHGIPIVFAEKGMAWKEGEQHFQVLAPLNNKVSGNEASIVLYAVMGGRSWLFAGDLEEDGEKQVIKAFPGLKADILKAGHHGSKTSTSSTWVEQLQPKAALLSSGRCSRFGHPHQEVLDILEAHEVDIYRTDEKGAVEITFHDKDILSIDQAGEVILNDQCKS